VQGIEVRGSLGQDLTIDPFRRNKVTGAVE
jgi:hypothetical protein